MGSLFFLDYSDEEIDAMGLPAWQEPLVRAMARFGLYISDTTNSNGSGIIVSPEGGGAYEQAGITSPIYDWLLGQGIDPVSSTENDRYHLYFLAGLPDVEIHIHLADPCVARELAGVAGGCP